MKPYLLLCLVLGFLQTASAQNWMQLDRSPMDMAYCPADYPILNIQGKVVTPPEARIIYSRPQKNGRMVFGELVEYDKVWRLGANEATEIDLYKDVQLGDKKLKKGRYTLYCIPEQDKWTIIFNKDTDTWGAFKYDATKDALRVAAAVQKLEEPVEAFTIHFDSSGKQTRLLLSWDTTQASLPVTFL